MRAAALTPRRTILACFAAVVLSFVSANAYEQWKASYIERAALEIHRNAAPGILQLSAARAELRRLQYLVDDLVDAPVPGRPARFRDVAEALRAVDGHIGHHERHSQDDDGTRLQAIARAFREVQRDVEEIEATLIAGGASTSPPLERLHRHAEVLSQALAAATDWNGAIAGKLAAEIGAGRRQVLRISFVLDLVGVALAIVAARLALRTVRAKTELSDQVHLAAERRAEELERFAGRVSHDIVSPLGTVSLTVDHLMRHDDQTDAVRTRQLRRARTAIDNVRSIVEGLLSFARAGAHADPAARARLRDVADECVLALSQAAESARVAVMTRELPDVEVACGAGALGSVVSNLVSNAVKYMGDAKVRVVEVSATVMTLDSHPLVRVEIADTGPGLPEGTQTARLFDLYVRGPVAQTSGLGLGLATVKRVVEAHGGTVGIRPNQPRGCVFWFTLPAIATTPAPTAPLGTGPQARAADRLTS